MDAQLIGQINDTCDNIFSTAQGAFQRDGFVAPITFVFARKLPDGTVLPNVQAVACIIDCSNKDQRRDATLGLIKKCDAVAIACIDEAWFAPLDESCGSYTPSQHPKRREAIMLYIEREDGDSYVWVSEITRGTDPFAIIPPTLGPINKSVGPQGGRLQGYFPATQAKVVQS